jgi:DNA-binding winged helix-turn-helix (wHTH) protein/Tol biopolymer transport system component
MSTKTGRIFQFGKFQIDALARTLRREESIVKLNSRAFDVLLYLVQNPGKVLTRDELLRNVWQDAFVDESSLPQTVSLLRRALEEKPGDHSYIVTVPGRGYQFASVVQVVASEEGNTLPEAATAAQTNSSGIIFQKHTVETSVITTKEEKEQLSSPTSRNRRLIGIMRAVVVLVAVAVVALALVVRRWMPWHPEQKHDLLERALTAVSSVNIVSSSLSRDGKFLAYNDRLGGLFVQEIATGETRALKSGTDKFSVSDWFADGTHLLVDGEGAKSGTWKMSIWDGTTQKISNEEGGYFSPDNRHIFVGKDDGIWSLDIETGEEHLMIRQEAGDDLEADEWSPSGRRVAFVRLRPPGTITIETCTVSGTDCTTALSETRLRGPNGFSDLSWLPDGRLVFALYELAPNQGTSNIWTLHVDPDTGRPLGKPERVTNWVGFQAADAGMGSFTHSADGRRFVLIKTRTQNMVKLAELSPKNDKAGTVRRLTNDTWQDYAEGWTRDSKSILFGSEHTGGEIIYKQPVTAANPEVLVSGPESYVVPVFTPDSAWLLYTAYSRGILDADSSRLMRRPVEGGPSSVVLPGKYSYDCAAPPSTRCVLAERKGKQIVFEALDPINGRGAALASVDIGSDLYHWSLSPDGNIALVRNDDSGISIVSLENGTVKQLRLKNWKSFQFSQWSPDGHFIYVGAEGPDSFAIFTTDLAGNTKVLVEVPMNQGWLASPLPSPDGHFLAFTERTYENNVTMLENF